MSELLTVLLVIVVIALCFGLAWLIREFVTAPLGTEDENGFHRTEGK